MDAISASGIMDKYRWTSIAISSLSFYVVGWLVPAPRKGRKARKWPFSY
jgi:hypothetical protein